MKKLLFALSAFVMLTLASCGGKSDVNIDDYVGKYKVTEVGGETPNEYIGDEIVVNKSGDDIEVMMDGGIVTFKKQNDGIYKYNGDIDVTALFEETSDGKILKMQNTKHWKLTAKKVD